MSTGTHLGWGVGQQGIVEGIKSHVIGKNSFVFVNVIQRVNKQRRELSKVKNHVASRTNGYKFVHGCTRAGSWKKVPHFKTCSDIDTSVTLGKRNSASGGTCVLGNFVSGD